VYHLLGILLYIVEEKKSIHDLSSLVLGEEINIIKEIKYFLIHIPQLRWLV